MEVYLHSGKCCGIKTIFGLEAHPGAMRYFYKSYTLLPGEDPITGSRYNYEKIRYTNFDGKNICNVGSSSSPTGGDSQRYDQRLCDILDWIAKTRNENVVEVVLNEGQFRLWDQTLQDIGFKMVTDFRNSNSSLMCYIYHIVTQKNMKYRKDLDERLADLLKNPKKAPPSHACFRD